MSAAVTYLKNSGTGYNFEQMFVPTPSKVQWGLDTLTQDWCGAAPALAAFVASLSQGDTYTFSAQTYYLVTWSSNNDPIFPTVTLTFQGFFADFPDPVVSGQSITQTGTISCTSPSDASRTFTYITRQSTYDYFTDGRPSGPTYTSLDVDIDPVIIKSVVNNADGTVYLGDVPSDLLTALTPVGSTDEAFTETVNIPGTIYYSNRDTVTRLLPSNGA